MNFRNLLVFLCLNWSLVNCYGSQYFNSYNQPYNYYPSMGYYQSIPRPSQRDCSMGQMANLLLDIILPPTSYAPPPQYIYQNVPQPQYGFPPTFQPLQSTQPNILPETPSIDPFVQDSNASPIELQNVSQPESDIFNSGVSPAQIDPTECDIPEQDDLIYDASPAEIDMPPTIFETPIDSPTVIDTQLADETLIPTEVRAQPAEFEVAQPVNEELPVGEDEPIVAQAQTTSIAVDGPSPIAQPLQPILMYPVVCGTPVQMVNPCGTAEAGFAPNAGGQQVCVCPNVCYCSNPAPIQPVLT